MSEEIKPAAATSEVGSTTSEAPGATAPAKTETVTAAATAEAGAKPTEGQKPTESAKASVPEKYELKLPEGSTLEAADVDKIAQFSKERGLSQDQAQAILERDSAFRQANLRGGTEWTARVTNWEAQALADQEIGGTPEKLQESAELSKRALSAYFPEGIKTYLNDTGLGSHPDIIRGLVKIGKTLVDAKHVTGGTKPVERNSVQKNFYPDLKP